MIKRLKYLVVGALALSLTACETDLKVNADYAQTAVVYATLNSSDTIHIMKLSRTFLGDGNALDFAQRADSSRITFAQQPYVERIVNGKVDPTHQYTVRDTIITGKPEGTFYSGSDVYYYFVDPLLTPSYEVSYRLSFKLNDKDISATTLILGKSIQTSPGTNVNSFELLSADPRVNGAKYKNVPLKVTPGINVKRIEAEITFSYTEQYLNGNPDQVKTLVLTKDKLIFADSKIAAPLSRGFDAKGLMDRISTEVLPDDNVKQRIIGNIAINLTGAGEDLNTYIEVNNPISGVLQERPEFTNVVNGLGIFSSVYDQTSTVPAGDYTSIGLTSMPQYIGLKFCSTRPILANDATKRCQ